MKDEAKKPGDKQYRIKYRRMELLIPPTLYTALENYRASKRPIPNEADAIRWLLREALETEGFKVDDAAKAA